MQKPRSFGSNIREQPIQEKERPGKLEITSNKIQSNENALSNQSKTNLYSDFQEEEHAYDLHEGLDPELGERLEKIHTHNQNVNTLDNLVCNFKKNLQYLQGKIEKKEKYKINNHLLCIKIQEFERENVKLRDDYLYTLFNPRQAKEECLIKENLLNEFQTVFEKSKARFRAIEEENVCTRSYYRRFKKRELKSQPNY